jgi:hypothetical protein
MVRRLSALTLLHVVLAATAGAQERISIAATLPHAQIETAFERELLPLATLLPEQGVQSQTVASDGVSLPQPSRVMSRDAAGRATVRAVRLDEPLRIDGNLNERVYQEVDALSGFVQVEPDVGAAATEETDVWVFFDDDNVYVSARVWDSAPESEWVANEMRRDSFNVLQNDRVGFLFDTFYDRRNGVIFNANPIGGRTDGQMTDERTDTYNGDFNPIWDVRTGRFEQGWTLEAVIPFKSLRYRAGQEQVWGFNVVRYVRWKNEISYLVPVPAGSGLAGIFRASRAATLVGLEAPKESRNLEVKPYAISELTTDQNVQPVVSNDLAGDVGLDVKYGVTDGLVADLTVNTDFAQVEADEQQVNLTRFSLFFPEKREFFLENQGLFAFGGGGGNTPILFHSRQIGLLHGREVPIRVGGRLTGRAGRFTLGVMNIKTGDAEVAGTKASNFSVVRVKRDILRRSSIGALFTGRSVSALGSGSSQSYGFDGGFAFYDNLNINSYWATTRTRGLRGDDVSYRSQVDYNGDRYGLQLDRLVVGDDFNPEVGFVRRDDMERSFGSFRFSPRPQSIASVRKVLWSGHIDHITDRNDRLETRESQGQFGIEFSNSDQFNLTYTRSYDLLDQPFRIASDVTIPSGGYSFQDVKASYALGQQRTLAGSMLVQHGTFFRGEKTTLGFSRGRVELTPQLSVEPSISLNLVDLPEGRFTAQLVTTRTTYTVSPQMFVSALLQYNSSNESLSTNLRMRWEYRPGSELFVVYNEQRDTLMPNRYPELDNRAFVIKISRLLRF